GGTLMGVPHFLFPAAVCVQGISHPTSASPCEVLNWYSERLHPGPGCIGSEFFELSTSRAQEYVLNRVPGRRTYRFRTLHSGSRNRVLKSIRNSICGAHIKQFEIAIWYYMWGGRRKVRNRTCG